MERKKDSYYNIKYIGYCLSQLPPDNVTTDFADFINYAKFQLCQMTHTLMQDPVWESYNDEQILVEYYAHVYSNNEKARSSFESSIAGISLDMDDWGDWADQQIAENQKEREKLIADSEDDISFSPEL